MVTSIDAWRDNREPGWQHDIGYRLQRVLTRHTYLHGNLRSEVGWHPCVCGWEGYWSDFEPHVADFLRAEVVPA